MVRSPACNRGQNAQRRDRGYGWPGVPYLSLVYLSFFGLPTLGLPAPALAVAIGCAALCRGGNFCERRRAALHIVLRGQPLAAMSLVLSCWQVQRYIVAPQLLGLLSPPTLSLAIMMYNDSAIVSVMRLPEMPVLPWLRWRTGCSNCAARPQAKPGARRLHCRGDADAWQTQYVPRAFVRGDVTASGRSNLAQSWTALEAPCVGPAQGRPCARLRGR